MAARPTRAEQCRHDGAVGVHSSKEILKILLLSISLFYGIVLIAHAIYIFTETKSLDILFNQLFVFDLLPYSILGIWTAANISKKNYLSKRKVKNLFRVLTALILLLFLRVSIPEQISLWSYSQGPFSAIHIVILSLCLLTFLVCPTLEKTDYNTEAFK